MRACGAVLLALAIGLCCLPCGAADTVPNKADVAAQERLIALYSTYSRTSVSSTTTTVMFSCHITPAAAVACTRRRRKRRTAHGHDQHLESVAVETPALTSSQQEPAAAPAAAASADSKARLFFTIWRTSMSTVTFTSRITNFSTTVSISLSCTASGQSLLPNCATG